MRTIKKNRHTTYIKTEVDAALTKDQLCRIAAIQDRRLKDGEWDLDYYKDWSVSKLREHTAR